MYNTALNHTRAHHQHNATQRNTLAHEQTHGRCNLNQNIEEKHDWCCRRVLSSHTKGLASAPRLKRRPKDNALHAHHRERTTVILIDCICLITILLGLGLVLLYNSNCCGKSDCKNGNSDCKGGRGDCKGGRGDCNHYFHHHNHHHPSKQGCWWRHASLD